MLQTSQNVDVLSLQGCRTYQAGGLESDGTMEVAAVLGAGQDAGMATLLVLVKSLQRAEMPVTRTEPSVVAP